MNQTRQQDITTIMAEVASAVVGQFDMHTLLNEIIKTTMQILNAEVCSIFLEDKDSDPGNLECVAGSGFAEEIVGEKYKIGEGFTSYVFASGKEFNIKTRNQLEKLKDDDGNKVWKGQYDNKQWPSGKSEFRNLIALPLQIQEQKLGVIKAENKIEKLGDYFSNEDLTNFKTIATVISLVIENTRLVQKSEAQSRRITDALSSVANAIVGQFEMKALLDQISETTIAVLEAENCMIFLEDQEENPGLLECVSASGYAKNILGATYGIGEGFTGTVFEFGRDFNFKSREQLEKLEINGKMVWKGKHDKTQWKSGKSEYRNGIGMPLKIQDKIFGVFKVENKKINCGDYFSQEDLTICKTIANVVALVIENTRLVHKAEIQSRRISNALSYVANAVVGQFDMEALLNKIINTTMVTLHAEVCSIFLEDTENEPGILECMAGSGFAEQIIGEKYKIGDGFTSYVFESGKEFNIKTRTQLESLKDERGNKVWKGQYDHKQWPSGKSEFRNLIALPLKIQERTLGVIKAENKKREDGDHFSDEDLTIFKTIANVVALTIENARLHDQIETQLKLISVKAAHRINNQAANYDGIELDLWEEIENSVPNRENLEQIHERLQTTTKNLKNMIGEFQRFGKPINLDKTPCSINQIIHDEIWLARPDQNMKIVEYLGDGIPVLFLDAPRFAESVKELISNSIKAVKKERKFGGIINISTEYNREKNEVRLCIEDNGAGFPQDFPIFEPFQTTDTQGTGLGLATVKELIEAHGGTITIGESYLGGAIVQCKLPVD